MCENEIRSSRKNENGGGILRNAVRVIAFAAAIKACAVLTKNLISEAVCHREEMTKDSNHPEFYAFMNGRRIGFDGEEFSGAVFSAFMGGLDIDLRRASVEKDVVVLCRGVMGGINIKVPNDVNVSVSGCSLMGGIANMVPEDRPGATIYLRAECVMGGVCVRMAGVEEDAKNQGTDTP